MICKKNIGVNEAFAIVRAMQSRVAEAQGSINRLANDVYEIPSWCKADVVGPLVEKFAASTKGFDEIMDSVNDLVDFLNKYIDAAYIGNNTEIVELMNSQKIAF
jgi:hypothetical protein